MTELIISRSENPDDSCDLYGHSAIVYRAIIGIEGDEMFGFCVGEARARLINGQYLLENTEDVMSMYVPGSERGEEIEDKRRFLVRRIARTRKEADNRLIPDIRNRVDDVARWTGLQIKDLTGKVFSKKEEYLAQKDVEKG